MKFQAWVERATRGFFGLSFVLLVIAVVERLSNALGYTVLGQKYTPGRLLEFAGILMLFVVALLLRTIRDEIRKN